MSERKEYSNTTDYGTRKVRVTKNGDVYLDSYNGDVKDPKNHDRFTVKISSGDGKPTGHGYDHKPW